MNNNIPNKIINNILNKNIIVVCEECGGDGLDENMKTCKKCDGAGSYVNYAQR